MKYLLALVAAATIAMSATAQVEFTPGTPVEVDGIEHLNSPRAVLILESIDDQTLDLRLTGDSVPSFGTWLRFPKNGKLKPEGVQVEGTLGDGFQVMSKVVVLDDAVEVRIGVIEVGTPLRGITPGALVARIQAPATVDLRHGKAIQQRTSASSMNATSVPLTVVVR